MNHLAHFHLAGDSEGHIVGALLGDYVKGPLRGELPPEFEQGVRLHRRIDAFTDSHPTQNRLRSLFDGGERRLAGIVIDLYFDHLLVRHWARFHHLELRAFSNGVHRTLASHAAELPAPARTYIARMREHDLLYRYHDLAVIDGALRHIGIRLGREQLMSDATHRARQRLSELETAFLEFYPQAMACAGLSVATGTR